MCRLGVEKGRIDRSRPPREVDRSDVKRSARRPRPDRHDLCSVLQAAGDLDALSADSRHARA